MTNQVHIVKYVVTLEQFEATLPFVSFLQLYLIILFCCQLNYGCFGFANFAILFYFTYLW